MKKQFTEILKYGFHWWRPESST